MMARLRNLPGPGDIRAWVCALSGKVLLASGGKAAAAAVLAQAGDGETRRVEDCLKQAMQLHFERGDAESVRVIGRRLRRRGETDPDIAFMLMSVLPDEEDKNRVFAFQRLLLKSRNLKYVSLCLSVLKLDTGSEGDYELLQETSLFLEQEAGGRALHAFLSAHLVMWALERCDYPAARCALAVAEANLKQGRRGILGLVQGLHAIHWWGDDGAAAHAVAVALPPQPEARARRRAMPHRWDDDRIRIGYVSADFLDIHATMQLLGNVLERHDRSRFDVTLFCHTPDDYIARNNFDRTQWGDVVDIREMSDEDAVRCIRDRNTDILVDLKGYTMHSRNRIFNFPAAPVHVAWLGYPTTAVNVDLDYVIGDPFVLPDSARPDWKEAFCRLPETYQPNDPVRRPPPTPLARADFGLPPDRFIFGSFNNPHKITPAVIDLWCRILRRTPDGLMWIYAREERQQNNLLKEFVRQGIAAERVSFMSHETPARHLDRMQLADLGLDTFPYNGHTTTSEQLWSGLPVLAVRGTHFASRVSESLLNAIGLPELVAGDNDAYVELAVSLYHDRERLSGYRRALEAGRFTRPLFDAERFCRHLERAYATMAARAKAGLEPDVIDVPAMPARQGSFEEGSFEEGSF
ncbi:MAG: glycosyl transferase [Pseudochelatococcus sp.]|uniref:O-linked N-acetylglucosamine transferase, SPINDLY family protein n=1 Tax=Pseudochelatococcus sp. TaxID=2020869 RepID=UPI003D8DCADD